MLLEAISAIFLGTQLIKEAATPHIPAENWRNKKLMNEDKLNPNISPEQVMKNLANGKYYLPDVPPNAVIDDMEAYHNDMKHYRFDEVYRFAQQGKYKKARATKLTDECDFILVCSVSYKDKDIDREFIRSCKSIDKYKSVRIAKSMCFSEKTNVKINAAYNLLLQRLKDYYGGNIIQKSDGYCVRLLLKEV